MTSRGKTQPTTAKREAHRRPPTRIAATYAPKSRGRLSELRREIVEIEKRIIALAAQRAQIELELCKDPMHGGLQAQHAALRRDAPSTEPRTMDAGTAIEEAAAAALPTDRRA